MKFYTVNITIYAKESMQKYKVKVLYCILIKSIALTNKYQVWMKIIKINFIRVYKR